MQTFSTSSNFRYPGAACEFNWIYSFVKIRDQKDLKSIKKGVSWIENLYKMLKILKNTFWWKIEPILGPNISGTKCDRDKPIFFTERGGQSDCVDV